MPCCISIFVICKKASATLDRQDFTLTFPIVADIDVVRTAQAHGCASLGRDEWRRASS